MIEPKIEQIHLDEPPCKIEEFLDRLIQGRQKVVPGSLIWLPHPEKQGQFVVAVMVEDIHPGGAAVDDICGAARDGGE